MRNGMLRSEIKELVNARNWPKLREQVKTWPPPEIADLLFDLGKEDRGLFFLALPRDIATETFAYLRSEEQNEILRSMTDEETRQIIAGLSPDDRTHILEELPGAATQRLLNLLSPEDLEEARFLLGYPEESVGRLMTPDYVAVRPNWTVSQALDHIRSLGLTSETINRIFVVDDSWHLLDDIELKKFIFGKPDDLVADLMDHSVASISAFADREKVVDLIRKYDQSVLPVVDSDGVLVGIVTVDDVMDVQVEEATEDFHKGASVGKLKISLRDAPLAVIYRARIGWLLVLVFMNIFSGAGIAAFEETLGTVISLAFFLPLLIDSGGNAGSQSATLMIRAMAVGDVRASDWLRLLGKEVAIALALGLTMSAAVSAIAFFRAPEIIAIVGITMSVIVLVGSMIGMSLPFIFTKLGWDPATASGPLITSLADISGVLLYFTIATWFLGLEMPWE